MRTCIDLTLQSKAKNLLLTYKEKKEYRRSESEPFIIPAYHLAYYFLERLRQTKSSLLRASCKGWHLAELVDARHTSQECSQCGIMVPKKLADRVYSCTNCGLEMDRDTNASLNIRALD